MRAEVDPSATAPKDHVTPDVEVRLAEDVDGPAIGRLVVQAGFAVATLDWSKVYPYWLVADREDRVVGCIQVCMGLPIARLELMATDPELSNRARARVVKALLIHGLAMLKREGAEIAAGVVPGKLKGYQKILLHRGAIIIWSGDLFAKRLR